MTFQRKLLLGFGLMVLPALLLGVQAIRSNAAVQHALQSLGESLTRTRTYSEVETAMFNQSEIIWRALSGLDPQARREFQLQGEVVDYWFDRWSSELQPDEHELSDGVRQIETQIRAVADSVFQLQDAGKRAEAYALAKAELKQRLLPALTEMNHRIYRRAREFSVSRAFARVQEIVAAEQRILTWILVGSLGAALLGAWAVSRGLSRPLAELREAMGVVGRGDLDHPVQPRSGDEIGDLARSFQQMTANLRASRAELEQAQARLLESEKLASVGQMAAAVAHGLRNPLASLRASAQLALRHPESPSAKEALGDMISEVDRLDKRITHLLAFSRPAPDNLASHDLGELVRGLVPAIRRLAAERGVEVDVSVPEGLPRAQLDPLKTEQAIHELVANALDAMGDGGTLTLQASSSGGRVFLDVRDTGRGVPVEARARIFDPFFTTRPDGTGLGLATARRFIEQAGGAITIEDTGVSGTVMRIALPLAREASA